MKLTDITAVIFDMDGVIFDTERVYLESCVEAAAELNLGDIRELCISCIGITAEMTKNRFRQVITNEELCNRFWELSKFITREKLSHGMPIKEGAENLLSMLYKRNIPIALASSTTTRTVTAELTSVDLLRYFTIIVGGDMVNNSKPDPEIFLKAADMLGAEPEKCLVLEDSKNGIRAAKAAGMKAIMIPDLIPPDDEMKEKADLTADSLNDVISYLMAETITFSV